MKHSHEVLDKLINHISDQPGGHIELFLTVDFNNLKHVVIEEAGNMKKYLNRKALPIKDERSFQLLVHQYQEIIIGWLDKILKFKKEGESRYPIMVYEMVIEELQQLLLFINNRFDSFFNYEQKVPDIYVQSTRQKLKKRILLLEDHLCKELINKEILQLIMQRFQVFLCEKSCMQFLIFCH